MQAASQRYPPARSAGRAKRAGQASLGKAGLAMEMCFPRMGQGGDDLLDIGPNPPTPDPPFSPCPHPPHTPRKGIFCDSLSGNLGPFPTFYVSGLIPGNTQGL